MTILAVCFLWPCQCSGSMFSFRCSELFRLVFLFSVSRSVYLAHPDVEDRSNSLVSYNVIILHEHDTKRSHLLELNV